jgi:phosphoribosylanthranilate isomerase
MCPVRVKVCGIRTPREALAAVEEGVHALGFLFASSPRQVTPEIAAAIIKELPPFIGKVGVFVNEESGKVKEIAAYCGLDTLQFHGEETAAYCCQFPAYKVIKAFPASPSLSMERCREYRVSAILLDTKYAGKKGGGGLAFDWRLAQPFCQGPFPLVLAGGLNEDNVFNALEVVKPFGVDVSSGVERNGFKDQKRIRALMEQIKRWEYQHLFCYNKRVTRVSGSLEPEKTHF